MDTTLVQRLADQIDIEGFHDFARKKGLLPMKQNVEFRKTISSMYTGEQLQTLVNMIGEWRSLLLLCAFSSECKKSQFSFEAETEITSRFRRAAEEIPIQKFHSIQIADVFVSDGYELHSLCFSLAENGENELLRKVIKSVVKNWTEIEVDVDSTEKQRRADLCLMGLCIISQILKDDDELKIKLKKAVDRAKHYTADPDEALGLIRTSELQRIAYGDTNIRDANQMAFPEDLKHYTSEKYRLSTRGYILATEIMFLISHLSRRFSSDLHQKIITKLTEFNIVFEAEQENSSSEDYRKSFLRKRNCLEALCRLGISFTLENLADVKPNQEEMKTVRQCLVSITKPEVWKFLSPRWKALTYAALTKWFYLLSESEKAEQCVVCLKKLLPKFLTQGKDTVQNNAHILLESISIENEMQLWDLEQIKFETEIPDQPIKILGIPDNVVVVQTMSSNEIDGTHLQNLFQHILLVAKQEAGIVERIYTQRTVHSTKTKEDYTEITNKAAGGTNDAVSGFKENVTQSIDHEVNLQTAIRKQDMDMFRKCLHGWDPQEKDSDGMTALELSLQLKNPAILKEVGHKICSQFEEYMHKKQKNLLYKSWMGYIPCEEEEVNANNLRIVALHSDVFKPTLLTEFRNIRIYWRQKEKVSDEAKATAHNEDIDSVRVEHIPGEKAEQLFKMHRNLNIIHISTVRSTRFQTLDEKMIPELCVALYCQVKGIVPIGENIFPKEIDHLRTDVREGYAVFGAGELLRPGVGIYCPYTGKTGTLGGFVESKNGELGFLTVAHLVAKREDLIKHEVNPGISISRETNMIDTIGIVTTGCFLTDNTREPSVDAVLARVDKSQVIKSFQFPMEDEQKLRSQGYRNITLPKIVENEIATFEDIDSNSLEDILKYGTQTGLTTGKLAIDDIHVRLGNVRLMVAEDNTEFTMYHQIGIRRIGTDSFFELGDSGSFCYMIDKNDRSKIKPFGMAIGMSSGFCIVTPLENVFQKLGLDLKRGDKLYPLPDVDETEKDKTKHEDENDDVKALLRSMTGKQEELLDNFRHQSGKQDELLEDVKSLKADVETLKCDVKKLSTDEDAIHVKKRKTSHE